MERKAFRAKKIVTMGEQGDVENGIMLTAGGKVEQVGAEGELEIPNSAERYDFTDKVLLPGFVDAHSHLGIHEDAEGWEGQDTNEMTDPVTPQLRGIDGLNPEDLGLQDAAVAGVTTVNTGPGSGNVIGGQFVAVKTGGASVVEDKVISEPTAMKMATGENPKRVYREKDSMPSTRTGTAAKLRQALFDAQNYRERKSEGEKGFKKDFGLESLLPVLKGELKAKIHAHRADDIVTAVRIAEEFGLSYSIEHCTEGHKVAQFLAERGAEAVAGPFFTSRSKRELMQRSFRTPGILS
ncbi:MAG: amidohydrolase, partial [Candidatus Bipolaricaulota bacterium]